MMEIVFMIAIPAVAICFAFYYEVQYLTHRNQVLLLQAQCREYRRSPTFPLKVGGLWADLDEKDRLRERVAELESNPPGLRGGG